jgi:Tol biopolymer transport system component
MVGGGQSRVRVGTLAAAAVIVLATIAAYAILGPSNETGDRGEAWRTIRLTDLPGLERGGSLSPDGDRFVYDGDAAGNLDIYLQFVEGGNPFNLTEGSPAGDSDPVIGPDGQIAFRSNREPAGIYVMGPSGENQRLLVAGGFHPDWSSDGSSIVYSTHGFTDPEEILGGVGLIATLDRDTGDKHELVEGIQPTFSPSGARVAYWTSVSGGRRDIWTVGADGTDAVPLTSDAFLDWSPRWSPDGQHLYFASNRGEADNIWRIRVDQQTGVALGTPQQVTTGGADRQGFLSFSADGNRLLYTSNERRSNIQRIVFDPVVEEVIGEPEAVTSGSRRIRGFDISPDGRRVAYQEAYPQEDIVVMDVDGTNRVQVTDDAARDRRPRWSPDGGRIAVYSDAAGYYHVWTFNPDGGSRMRHTTGMSVWWPSWSPDGQQLVYYVPPSSGHPEPGAYVVDADTPFDEQTPDPLLEGFLPTDWSADGRIVGGGSRGFWIFKPATQAYESLEVQGFDPRWFPDGERIVYRSGVAVWLANVTSGESNEILNLLPDTLSNPMFIADGRMMYFLRTERGADIYLLRRESSDDR